MAFFPFYSQYDPDDCGVMALRMVCAWHGKELEPSEIREACQVPFGELSFLSLNQGAESLGFNAISVRLQPDQWNDTLVLPAIAHVFTQHFVVIIDITDKDVHLADPLRGMLKIDREVFQKDWLLDEPLHLLILNLNASSDRQKLVVKPKEEEHMTKWSFMTMAVLFLEVIIILLSFQWIGLSVSISQEFIDHLGLWIGVTLLLAVAFLLLQRQWHLFLKSQVVGIVSYDESEPSPLFTAESPDSEWIQTFHHERKGALSQLPRSIVLIAIILVYTLVQCSFIGLWTMGIVALFLWVTWKHSSNVMASFVHSADQWLHTLVRLENGKQETGKWHNVFTKWVSPKLLWIMGFVWILGILTLKFVLPFSLQDGFLFSCIGAATGYYLYLTLLGIRALQWRYYRPLGESNEYKKDDLPSEGDIQLRLADDKNNPLVITYPYGKSTLVAGPYLRDVAKIMESLKANAQEEGSIITYGGIPISKHNRASYLKKFKAQSNYEGTQEDVEQKTILGNKTEVLNQIASILGVPQEGFGAFLNTPHSDKGLEVKRKIGKALALDPECLLIDQLTEDLDPFEEVILLENVIEYRQGRTTVIASNRAELIPSVDQVVYVNLKDKVMLEQREDIESA